MYSHFSKLKDSKERKMEHSSRLNRQRQSVSSFLLFIAFMITIYVLKVSTSRQITWAIWVELHICNSTIIIIKPQLQFSRVSETNTLFSCCLLLICKDATVGINCLHVNSQDWYSKDPNTRGVPNNCLQNDTFSKT